MKVVNNKSIVAIIKILKQEVKKLETPSVTKIALEFRTPFHVLISCILSLRTKDNVTIKASKQLFALASTPQEMAGLCVSNIEKTIYPVGFYHTKAKNIKSICDDLIRRFHGKVPDDIELLLSLQGVGRKTANLVLTEGFNKLGVCVDTHVHRISNRIGYIRTSSPDKTEISLRKKLPRRYWKVYNYLLVTWGQNVCRPISPHCSICSISSHCEKIDVGKRR